MVVGLCKNVLPSENTTEVIFGIHVGKVNGVTSDKKRNLCLLELLVTLRTHRASLSVLINTKFGESIPTTRISKQRKYSQVI